MMAATVESHQSRSKSGICESTACITPNRIMYGLLEVLHVAAPCPCLWKQLDLWIALHSIAMHTICIRVQPIDRILIHPSIHCMQQLCSCDSRPSLCIDRDPPIVCSSTSSCDSRPCRFMYAAAMYPSNCCMQQLCIHEFM
jgi:hypothetical protein